ncbi:MAG: hypothetical protein R6U40_08545 [Desulfobacterales bacterium]
MKVVVLPARALFFPAAAGVPPAVKGETIGKYPSPEAAVATGITACPFRGSLTGEGMAPGRTDMQPMKKTAFFRHATLQGFKRPPA